MDFSNSSSSYLQDDSVKNADTTDKKKRLSDMSNAEKEAYYDAEIEKLKMKLKKVEAKKKSITTVTKNQRTHALCNVAGALVSDKQILEWYQLPPKEREAESKAYGLEIKKKLERLAQLEAKQNI